MFLYTPVPYEAVFPEKIQHKNTIAAGDGLLEEQGGTVSRLISTNPSDYLNPAFMPGEPIPQPDKPTVK